VGGEKETRFLGGLRGDRFADTVFY